MNDTKKYEHLTDSHLPDGFSLKQFLIENKISCQTCAHRYWNSHMNKDYCKCSLDPLPSCNICEDYIKEKPTVTMKEKKQ